MIARFSKLFILFLLVACNFDNLPDGILSHKKMVPILVDIHLAEAINNQRYNLSLIRDSLPEDLYYALCKKFNLDHRTIEQSLFYYGKYPDKYIPIYNEVLDVLSEMEVKAKSDSIQTSPRSGFDKDTSAVKHLPE